MSGPSPDFYCHECDVFDFEPHEHALKAERARTYHFWQIEHAQRFHRGLPGRHPVLHRAIHRRHAGEMLAAKKLAQR